MGSIQGDTRRTIRWCVRGLRPSTPLRDLLFLCLMIAWVLLGVGAGPLPYAHANGDDGGGAAHRGDA